MGPNQSTENQSLNQLLLCWSYQLSYCDCWSCVWQSKKCRICATYWFRDHRLRAHPNNYPKIAEINILPKRNQIVSDTFSANWRLLNKSHFNCEYAHSDKPSNPHQNILEPKKYKFWWNLLYMAEEFIREICSYLR